MAPLIEPSRNWVTSPDVTDAATCGPHYVTLGAIHGIAYAFLYVDGAQPIAVEGVTSLVRACALADLEISRYD